MGDDARGPGDELVELTIDHREAKESRVVYEREFVRSATDDSPWAIHFPTPGFVGKFRLRLEIERLEG